jgi:hypothetical protein
VTFETGRVMARVPFYDLLDSWKENLLRAKGRVHFPDGVFFVEWTAGRLTSRPWRGAGRSTGGSTAFVVIATGLDREEIAGGLERIASR